MVRAIPQPTEIAGLLAAGRSEAGASERRLWGRTSFVIDPPRFDDSPRIVEIQELVLADAFLAQLAVEALDVGVLDSSSSCLRRFASVSVRPAASR